MPGGAKHKCTAIVLEKLSDYIDKYEDHGHAFPSISGAAIALDVPRRTMHDWANIKHTSYHKKFSLILDKLKAKQELVAWNKGMKNEYNANLCKLLLGKHGYHDRQATELSGPEGSPISVASTVEFIGVSKDSD